MQDKTASISDRLINQLAAKWPEFTTQDEYITTTRNNGLELITVANRQVKITNLSTGFSHILQFSLSFDPIALAMNKSEQLLCLYNESNCCLVSLNIVGSRIHFTTFYSISLALDESEKVIQVLFNNISKFQAEIVVLTTHAIKCYDINSSIDTPCQVYKFQSEQKIDLSSDFNCVVDPVSISFGSCTSDDSLNPKGDITLFVLTSDTSLYKIYPFLPNELSCSDAWKTSLFDYTTLKLSGVSLNDAQTVDDKFFGQIQMLKFASAISKSNGNTSIAEILPSNLRKGKIMGPFNISLFPDELYAQDALKLVPLQNDLLCILLNQALVVLFDDQEDLMLFDDDEFDLPETEVTVVECILLQDDIRLTDAIVQPGSASTLLLTTSTPELLRIDFRPWCSILSSCLEKNDLTEFTSLLQDPLPTRLTNFGSFSLPSVPSASKPSQIGLGAVYDSENYQVPLSSNQYKIWLAWDDFKTFAVVLNEGNLDVHDITVEPTVEEDIEHESFSISNKVDADEFEPYTPLLVGTYSAEVMQEMDSTKTLIAKMQTQLLKLGSNGVIEEGVEDLNKLSSASEYLTTCLISTFKNLASLNKRLLMDKAELMNQINTLNQISIKKKSALEKSELTHERINNIKAKQIELSDKLSSVFSAVREVSDNQSKPVDVELSKEEVGLSNELKKLQSLTLDKETQIENVSTLLQNLKKADIKEVAANAAAIQQSDKSTLETLEKKLSVRGQILDQLRDEIDSLKIE
ncbi:hypothetical protein CANARDRAFT_203277 [[Candida] arabinofermentans NRRL YB-2248]|uniref:Uncharacterized protein n=1 Tax=[Candida] arabinofermentans NRRL YB-2248 TaxID=983967 RepID=A0A1E4SVF2_9ASCO|nr:hypothetical protein CANARDRAFT_203277 [[Candida] arabinofermentans NRRL YB-2248]